MRPITHIIIHCSATPNGQRVTAEDIDRWHRERGWKGIGYHYVIEPGGYVKQGRPLEHIGAHTLGYNATSVGICMGGTDAYFEEQWLALRSLVTYLRERFPVAGVCGHRDLSEDKDGDGIVEPWEWLKTCPGFDVSAWLAGGMAPLPGHVLKAGA